MVKSKYSQINIKKRSVFEWLLLFVLIFPFFQALLFELIKLPDAIKFLSDAFLIVTVFGLLIRKRIEINKYLLPIFLLVLAFFAYTLVVYFFNYQSVFYYIWGLRNIFRFFVAFIGFALWIDADDAKRCLDFFDVLYFVNFFVVLIQFFGGFYQDYLGGIFGTSKGCNGTLLLFLIIVVSKAILSFMRKEGSILKASFIVVSSLLIAALAEIKVFFLLFVLIVIISSVMTKHSVRKTVLLILGAFVILVFGTLLAALYETFSDFLSFDKIWALITNPNYSTGEDIGRITAIPTISERFLPTLWNKLFGLGLGNCDASSLAIFNTPFYSAYQHVHYTYFTYAMTYLETGLVGLILYVAFFVAVLVKSTNMYKNNLADQLFCQLTVILAVSCIILFVYNSSLKMDASYIAYFVLALPFISMRDKESSQQISV